MLATETDSDADETEDFARDSVSRSGANAAFPLLSRDRMIRRLISPRLWKHVLVTCGLIGFPLALAAFEMFGEARSAPGETDIGDAGSAAQLRGIAGLGLFLSAQLCLLICWVRSASAVDFRGGFRAWRWLAVLLLGASVLMLTGASSAVMDGFAAILQPLLGTLNAARPALLFVPAGACLAFVLYYLIPDMGRCRPAQSLLVCGVALAIGRVLFGMRPGSGDEVYGLAISELLIAGLVLSAIQLHCRFVIHVNPNPPVAVMRIPRELKTEEPEAKSLETEELPVTAAMLRDHVISVPLVRNEEKVELKQPEQKSSGDHAERSTENDRGRRKSSKKQLRRAG